MTKKLTPKERELYEERAAIMEYDGNMTRKQAEKLALKEICNESTRNEQQNCSVDVLNRP